MNKMRLTLMLAAALPALASGQNAKQAGRADQTADLKAWDVPWPNSRPRDPYVDPKSRVWFVGQTGDYVAYFDQSTSQFKKYTIEPGTHPHNLVVDAKGMVWFTGNTNGRIVKLDPNTGGLTNYMMPDAAVKDPHTMIFDPKGNVWFTAQQAGYVGHLTVADGKIRLFKMPTSGARPYGIVLDSKGRPWFDEFGTNKIGTIDPQTMELQEITLPNDRSRPRRIAVTSDDAIWYGDYTQGKLGRIDPVTKKIEEFPLPAGAGSMPYAMATDDHDRVWIAETGIQPNRLVAFDPRSRQFVTTVTVAGEPNTIRHMVFDKKSRQIWWGSDVNSIGRITVPPALVP